MINECIAQTLPLPNIEHLRLGAEDYVLKHGNFLDMKCQSCFSRGYVRNELMPVLSFYLNFFFFFLLLRMLFFEVLSGGVLQNAALVSHHCKFLLANLNCYSYPHLHFRTCPNQKGLATNLALIWYTWGAMFILFLPFVNLSLYRIANVL